MNKTLNLSLKMLFFEKINKIMYISLFKCLKLFFRIEKRRNFFFFWSINYELTTCKKISLYVFQNFQKKINFVKKCRFSWFSSSKKCRFWKKIWNKKNVFQTSLTWGIHFRGQKWLLKNFYFQQMRKHQNFQNLCHKISKK